MYVVTTRGQLLDKLFCKRGCECKCVCTYRMLAIQKRSGVIYRFTRNNSRNLHWVKAKISSVIIPAFDPVQIAGVIAVASFTDLPAITPAICTGSNAGMMTDEILALTIVLVSDTV